MPTGNNNYDPDMYKPKSEQLDFNSYQNKVASKNSLEEERKHIESTNRDNYKYKIPFINFSMFVALDPTEPLNGKTSLRLSKSILVFGIFVAVWVVFTMFTFGPVRSLFQAPVWLLILIYLVVGVTLLYIIIAKFIYKTEQKRRDMAVNRGNKAMNLGNVWGINPGGILEGKALGKKHTSVYYEGKEAIVMKILKKSVLVSDDMADWSHYEGLQYLEDTMARAGFAWTKVNMKYNTENDYIWDELNESLGQSSLVYGKDYTDLMNEIFVFQRNFTKAYSTVPVIYYIIKPEFVNTKKTFKQIILELSTIVKQQCRCTLEPVSNKEFLRLLKEYYGMSYLDIDTISEFISSDNAINVDIEVVKYINNDGELVTLQEEFVPNLPMKFKRLESVFNEKDIERAPEVEITEKYGLFGDKNIKQYGA